MAERVATGTISGASLAVMSADGRSFKLVSLRNRKLSDNYHELTEAKRNIINLRLGDSEMA
jgi:hypothetical protein